AVSPLTSRIFYSRNKLKKGRKSMRSLDMQSRSAAATIESQEEFVVVEMPLTAFEKLYAIGAIRKGFVVLMLALIWQGYATFLDNSLLFPTLSDTLLALFNGIVHGELLL